MIQVRIAKTAIFILVELTIKPSAELQHLFTIATLHCLPGHV